ncbi:TPA: PriCT-2 domain-containing protein [Neisseria meningitidis]
MANDYAPPTYDEVQAALSYIPTPATHNEWYPIAIAIKDALGENGFTLWDEWSRQGKGYNSSVVKSTWKSATPKPGGITAATLFRLARDNGYRPERPYVPPTPEQMAAREAEQRARDEAAARELADTRRQAAKKAYGIWKNADKTVDLNHAYLQRKGIAEAELVRGIRQNEYQGQRQLVIPLYQGGELVSVQTINEAGGKHFLKGGEKSGSYAVLGNLEREAHKGIVLAEGFATAASIRKATGAPVVIAFDSGNMIRIAENMASRLSAEQRVVFAADNDPSGTGLAAASQAAVILGSRARIALPDFSPETVERFQAEHGAWDEKRDRENLPTDFNDLHLAAGIEAVRAQMAAALQMPERQPEIAPASETPQPAAARNAAFSMSAANEKQAEQEQSMAQPPETPSQTPPHPEGSGIYAYASREQNGRHYAVFTGAFGKLFNYPVVPAEGAQTEQEAREAADQTITMHRNDDFIGTAWQSNKGQAEVYGWTNLPTFMPAKTGKEPQYGVRYENDERRQTVGYRSDIETMMQRDAVQLAEKQVQADERQPVSDWLAQSGLSAIQAGRARSILDKRINYRGYGETSRADFILERTAEGWTTRRGTDGNGKPTLGIWSPDGEVGYDITETEKQFADWLAQRQTENIRPSHEPNTVRQPERPSERPAVRLKEGHIRLENPVAFERTPFGYRTAEMAHNAAFERRHITIAGGRIVGAHPGLAQEMGWATVGEIRPKSEQTLQQEAQAAAEQAARAAETAKTAQAAVAAMRLNETAAQIAPELRQQAQQDINAALNDPTLDGRERIIAAQETAAAYRDNGRPSENPAAAAPPVDPEWEQAVADERRMNEERRAERAPWRDFPRLIRNGSLAELKDAAGYTQAKAGDAEAAYDMVKSLLSTETLDNIRELAGGRVPILISVKAQESSGKNKIPEAMAHAIRASTGWPVDAEIVQINKPDRTGSGSSHRLAFQPVFDGKVEAGRDYLILDDNSTMGGTIASLRGYIENRGGRVIGAAVMSARETALDIVPTRNQLNEIQRKHGDAPNDYWTREFGYGIDRLTRAEAGVIRSAGVFDSIRDRIAAARLQAGVGVDGTTVPRTPVDTAQPQRDRSGTNRPQQEQPDSIAPAPTQAAAPDAAAFSMPAANAKQAEQEQDMAQQTDNFPSYSSDNPYAPYAAHDAEVRQNADDWEARVPLTEAMLAGFNRQAEQQGYVTYIEARHASLGRFQAEKELDGRTAVIDGEFKNHGGASVYEAPRDFTVTMKQNGEDQDYFYTNSLNAALAQAETYLKERDRPIAENGTPKQPEHASPAETRTAAPIKEENGIEYGGSRTQDAVRPEPETITAAQVQENLRRARAAEQMRDAFGQPESNNPPEPQQSATARQPESLFVKSPAQEMPDARKGAEPVPETPAKPKPVLDLNYQTAAGLDARYVRYDGRYLDPNNARTVLFEDKGAKIKTAREDAQTVSDMLDTAQAKNWDSIRISGSREFKRQMWLEAELRGIPNSGYSPSKEDMAMRDQMRAARERNSIEAGGINRTAEASAHNPPPRQPENRQSAHSPSEQLVADDSVRLKSEAANLQTRAETPAQTRAANRAAETAVQAAGERQSLNEPAAQTAGEQAPNHALEAARAAYLSKADKLSKAAKEQLANHERDFAEAVKGIPEGNRESAMLHFYTSMQKRMSGTKLDMPEPTAAAQRGQTPQPEKPFGRPAAKQRDDGMDMDR